MIKMSVFMEKFCIVATFEYNFSRTKWKKQVCSEFVPKMFSDGICCEMIHLNLTHFRELLQNSILVSGINISGSFMESSLHLNHCARALYKMSMQ